MESILKHTLTILNGTLVLGTLLASLVLLSGYSYNLGSFGAFGLSADAIPMSFSDSVAASFYMGAIVVAKIWSSGLFALLIAVAPFVAVAILLFIVVFIHRTGLLDRLLAWDDKRIAGLETDGFSWFRVVDGLYKTFQNVASWAFTLIILAAIPILVVVAPYKYGLEQGEKLIDNFGDISESCQGLLNHKVACYTVRNLESGNVITKGGLVTGTADYIALYNGVQTLVYRRSDNLVLQISKPANDPQ